MRSLALFLILFLSSCSQAPVKPVEAPKIRPQIQTRLDQARQLMGRGQTRQAINQLNQINDAELENIEKAMKYNLKGVFYFSESDWINALKDFEMARVNVPTSTTLEAQVWLNIASVRFKQGLYAELKGSLDKIEPRFLPNVEVKKYGQLKLAWAVKYDRHFEIVETAVLLLKDAKTINDIQDSVLKERLNLSFKALSDTEKVKILDLYKNESWLSLAYLAQIEAESRYFQGDTSGARDVIDWLANRFSADQQIMAFVSDFKQRLDSSTRLSMDGIGVILPLSGDKASFGQQALMGIDAAIKSTNFGREITIHMKDSYNSPSVGAQAVRDLIQQHKVPLIIGGAFSETAKAEYLEAKKWGVLYISLAPIYIPRDEKNHLLIEIQGSIESQVTALVTDDMLNRFGKKVGVIHPVGEAGRAYADEFWRAALTKGMNISALSSYGRGTLDFRDTIQHFLGLKFPRERSEELEIYQEVFAQEKSSIRRIQNLPPAIDFDWVFIASYPHEALSLIPTFGYYDARNLKVFGGPSWSSRSFVNEKSLGRVYFVGEDPGDINQEFFKNFKALYNKTPTFLESVGYDSLTVAAKLLEDGSVSERAKFDAKMRALAELRGMNTKWVLSDGIWIKNMQPLSIRNGEIAKIFDGELR